MKSRISYPLFIGIILAVIAVGSILWMKYEERLVQGYIEDNGLTLLSDQELEDIKDEAYNEGFEDGKTEGFDDGYESALEDYNVAASGVTYATVYYVDGGDCYHMNPSCLSIRQTKKAVHETTLDKLRGTGLNPCDICVAHSDN